MNIISDSINDLVIQRYTWSVVDANSYLLSDESSALLFDAVDSQELYEAILPVEHLTIIVSHSHFDHISGLNHIREIKPDCQVISTSRCSENIGNCYRNMSSLGNVFLAFYLNKKKGISNTNAIDATTNHIKPVICEPANKTFEGETTFTWHNHDVRLLQFYGHSEDGLAAIIDKAFLFSGDTLLPIPVVTRFPGGSTQRYFEEDIPKLKSLESQIRVVFPGHGEPGSMKDMIILSEGAKA